jgi:hypothetical protein
VATCFYCGATLDPRSITSMPSRSQNRHTQDHVYPGWLTRQLTSNQRKQLLVNFSDRNLVPCCAACNSYKAHLHPLDWLVIMPNDFNAKKLAELLVALGENMTEVFDALRRRKKK